MNTPTALRVISWLIRDTFLQARASGVLGLMLAVSGLFVLFCLTISVSGGTTLFARGETREFLPPSDPELQRKLEKDPSAVDRNKIDVLEGNVDLLFRAFRVGHHRYREEIVYFVELLLAGMVADTAGLLFVLIWTAGFLPTFLEGSKVSILLAKAPPRWLLLLGKFAGVVVFVLAQTALFVGGTWLALALKTGVWAPNYLLCIPLLVLQFTVFYSISLLLAVCLRSAVACVLGSTLFWFGCWSLNYARNGMVLSSRTDWSEPIRWCTEVLYWLVPKPMDLGLITFDALRAGNYFSRALDPQALAQAGGFFPELSVLSSLLFAAVVVGLAAWRFQRTDY